MPPFVPGAQLEFAKCLVTPKTSKNVPTFRLEAVGSGKFLCHVPWSKGMVWGKLRRFVKERLDVPASTHLRLFMGHGGDEINGWAFQTETPPIVPITVLRIPNYRYKLAQKRVEEDPNCLLRHNFKSDVHDVRHLIDAKAEINVSDGMGYTPLCLAALNDDSIGVEALLNAKANVHHTTHSFHTPFTLTYGHQTVAVAQLLLDAKADINHGGGTATGPSLMRAIQNNDENTVRWLINAKADVNCRDSWGRTALYITQQRDYGIIEEMLTDAGGRYIY